ncbi:MAG: V-type ATP synthase subunit D, partial [Pseudomonadota bacterium]|nr:V-type ATP synthase subunit D [Pseudomonadota bacterium]
RRRESRGNGTVAKIALNKASLNRERGNLKTFERFLPSLELKRQQLMAEQDKAEDVLKKWHDKRDELKDHIQRELPMLAHPGIEPGGLVKLRDIDLGRENRLGVHLPVLESIHFDRVPYSYLAKPHWMDNTVDLLERMAELEIRIVIQEERVRLLAEAVVKVSQRVNLFEKVLIPRAGANIKRIRIYLSDVERAAVVRSKIAKRMHEREEAAA